MITGYQNHKLLQLHSSEGFQWDRACWAGIIAGVVLLVVPRGSPWSDMTFFSPAVIGRTIAVASYAALFGIWTFHMAIAIFNALMIAGVVARLTQLRAVLAGGVLGFALYLLNYAVVSLVIPAYRGNELSVGFTHVVFGLIAAGAYRGLLRRRYA